MNITTYAEAGATTGSSRLSWRDQGTHIVVEHACVQGVMTIVEAQLDGASANEGARVNSPTEQQASSGESLALDKSGSRPPTEQQQASTSGPEDAEWQQVLGRRKKLDAKEPRSGIIWGAPAHTDPKLLARQLSDESRAFVECNWRGSGKHRHMAVDFGNTMCKAVGLERVKAACSKIGLKLVQARRWALRERHRQAPKPAEPAPQPKNRFGAISLDEESLPSTAENTKGKRKAAKEARQEAECLRRDEHLRLKVGTINIGGGLKDKIAELEAYAARYKYDVVAVQEPRLKKGGKLAVLGYKAYLQDRKFQSGTEHGGAGLLVANHLAAFTSKEPCTVKDQIWIRISGSRGNKDLLVCCAYMLQESKSKEERDEAFEALHKAAERYTSKGCDVLILGDLNARLGDPRDATETRLIGRHGEPGARSGNGHHVVKIMRAAGLVNLGGQRPPKQGQVPGADYWFTRKDPPTGGLHVIDYILVSERAARCKQEFKVDYGKMDSDHNIAGAFVLSPRKSVRRRGRKKAKKRFKLEAMIPKSSKQEQVQAATAASDEYQQCLSTSFADFDPKSFAQVACPRVCGVPNCACAVVQDFIKRTEVALEASVGSKMTKGKFCRSWFDDEVRKAIDDRRAAHAKYLQHEGPEQFRVFRKKRRACKKLIAKKKQEDWAKLLERMEEAYKNDHRELWRLVKRLAPTGKKAEVIPMRGADGVLAASEEQILDVWEGHLIRLGTPVVHPLEDLGFADRVRTHNARRSVLSPLLQAEAGSMDRQFDDEEIAEGINRLAYYKAQAEDGTLNPMYKCGGAEMVRHLKVLFNHLLEREIVPASWQEATVVNLFKEGDPADPGNYRGIALISCLGKLYLSLWARRLADHAEGVLSDGQGGFRRQRSTVDQAIALHEILLRDKRAGKVTYTCFIDFRKAFDTVWHDGLWKQLWESGIRGKAWRILRNLYSSIHAQIRVGDELTKPVRMQQGVRQGCPVSPILFNYFVDKLSRELHDSGYGVDAGGKLLHSLLYADDVVLVAHSQQELQGLIDVVDRFCQRWHMDINLKKSEVMVVGGARVCPSCTHTPTRTPCLCHACPHAAPLSPCPDQCEGWSCRDTRLKVVKAYKYLGIWFADDLSWREHVRVTLAKASKKSASLGQFFGNSRVPARAKTLVWLSFVRPVLEYGCEVWTPNAQEKKQLEAVQTNAGVKIFKLNMKTNGFAVRALMQVQSLELRRLRTALKYYAKLLSMDMDRTVRRIVFTPTVKKARQGLGGKVAYTHWIPRVKALLKDPELKKPLLRLRQCLLRNGGVLPIGLDATLPWDDGSLWYDPIKRWGEDVSWLVKKRELAGAQLAGKSRTSTLRVVLRSCAGEETMPRFPLTKLPNSGPDQIRMRMLGGTSGLRCTLSHYNDFAGTCPFGCVEKEDSLHFLLHCPHYVEERKDLSAKISGRCTCLQRLGDDEKGVKSCADIFEGLDEVGKALFMLGGPVDGHSAEAGVDAACREYVERAYQRRGRWLEATVLAPLVTDLTNPPSPPCPSSSPFSPSYSPSSSSSSTPSSSASCSPLSPSSSSSPPSPSSSRSSSSSFSSHSPVSLPLFAVFTSRRNASKQVKQTGNGKASKQVRTAQGMHAHVHARSPRAAGSVTGCNGSGLYGQETTGSV